MNNDAAAGDGLPRLKTMPVDRDATVSRMALLRLAAEICRIFLRASALRPALSACTKAIARTLRASRVSIHVEGDEHPIAIEASDGMTKRCVPGEADGQFECAVAIRRGKETIGTLSVEGIRPKPAAIELFLESVAVELGRGLRRLRTRKDESARLQSERALQRSNLVGIVCLDESQRVTKWNAGARNILGWRSDDVVDRSLADVLGTSAFCELQGHVDAALHGRRFAPMPLRVRRWDGRESMLRIEGCPIINVPDEIVGVQLTFRDETAVKELQELMDAVTAISNGLTGFASIGDAGEYLLREVCSIRGWIRGELWQTCVNDRGWDLAAHWNAPHASLRTFESATEHLRGDIARGLPALVCRNRNLVHVDDLGATTVSPRAQAAAQCGIHDALGVPIGVDGDVAAVLLFFGFEIPAPGKAMSNALQAIASQLGLWLKRERLEAALREAEQNVGQSQKLESLGRLSGGIAHDFNNLLTIVLGHSEMVLESLGDDSPLSALVVEIEKAGHRAAALTRQLLAFSRKQALNVCVLDVNARIRETERMVQRLLGDRIELQFRLAEPLHRVLFDAVQFDQVLLNLAVNARDAIADAGCIAIATENVALSAAASRRLPGGRAGDYVKISVSDTGCGMDEQTQARVFEPFFTTKDQGKGTGMGLSTVHGIVHQSGGFLSIESRPGQGSTFSVFLPRTHELPRTLTVDDSPPEICGGNETILLVEDEDVLRSLAAKMLEARGYTVLQASDGHEALSLIARKGHDVDLLLTDVMMPGITGLELATRVRSAGFPIPVLFITGTFDPELTGPDVVPSGCRLIRKPFTSSDLAGEVRRVLDAPAGANEGD